MAKKVYTISNINWGIGSDKNFPQPWTVVDCENIDISADSNSIKIAGNDYRKTMNSNPKAEIIGSHYGNVFFTKNGDFFEEENCPSSIINTWIDDLSRHRTIKIPDIIPKRSGAPEVWGWWRYNQESEVDEIITWYVQYGQFLFFSTKNFLHIISQGLSAESKINNRPQAWEYEWDGWQFRQGIGFKHIDGTGQLKRKFPEITDSFQYEFAFQNFTKGTIEVSISYNWEAYNREKPAGWEKNEWVESTKTYRITKTYRATDYDVEDIHKICCLGEGIKNMEIFFHPTKDFDGELVYNALSLTPLYERSFNLQARGGIAYNSHPIPQRWEHKLFIRGKMLMVWCGNIIKTFTIDKSQNFPDDGIMLVPWNDILLGQWSDLVEITQYWSWIAVYTNKWNDAYQSFSNGVDGESEESIIWKDTKFLSVSNNGYQDFVVAKIWDKYCLYIVSWGNKKLVYQSDYMQNYISLYWPESDYFLNFGGKSFSREERTILSSSEWYWYLYDNIKWNYKLTKFFMGKGNILTFAQLGWEEIRYFSKNNSYKKNYLHRVRLWRDRSINRDTEWYVVIPPLLLNYNEWILEEIWFWAYLPNDKSSVELWAKSDEKEYITLWVVGQKNKDFSKVKFNNQVEAELIDDGLDNNGDWHLTFKVKGNLKKFTTPDTSLFINTITGKSLIKTSDISAYDYFIKLETITRENQKFGNKEIWYTHGIRVNKINSLLWEFTKLSLKFILKAQEWATESPKLYAPIYLIYRTKDDE